MFDELDSQGSQRVSRRAFIVAGVSVAGAVAARQWYRYTSVEAKSKLPQEVEIVAFSDTGERLGKQKVATIFKTDAEWKQQLSASAYTIARKSATEIPYSSKLADQHGKGIYRCICCATALFSSDTKFESGTGWPSFWQPIAKENVRETTDLSLGMERTAVSCRRCDAHLGHVFDDGPQPTGMRYCMNGASMSFVKS